jgi:transcriptional antiterminator RfaH
MHWYLIHTKPRQEKCALQNLEQQGYQCYLPTYPSEKLCQGNLLVLDGPLFPRYLFIRLGHGGSTKSWAPIRSTKGVNRLVSFGIEPAKIDDGLIDLLRAHETTTQSKKKLLFLPGEKVRLTEGVFAGVEGFYQIASAERRVMVLIELLGKSVKVPVSPASLRKTS